LGRKSGSYKFEKRQKELKKQKKKQEKMERRQNKGVDFLEEPEPLPTAGGLDVPQEPAADEPADDPASSPGF
jgi:hypothetical protein